MAARRFCLTAGALLLFVSCAGNHSSFPVAAQYSVSPELAGRFALAPPARLVSLTPVQSPLTITAGRYLLGAYALEQFPAQNVTADRHRALFSPRWEMTGSPTYGDAAYAVYGFDMTDYHGFGDVVLDWDGLPPPAGYAYVGLGNFELNRWDWFPLEEQNSFEVESFDPYLNEHPYLLLAVVVLGTMEARLSGVQLGERWYSGDIDLSVLCAPVVAAEADALRADWDARNPVEDDYQYIGDEVDDEGFRRAVISHRVDGYVHYGVVVVPPDATPGMPVIMVCHPGVGGTSLKGEYWFTSLFPDEQLKYEFVAVMPAFRGEDTYGGSLGTFESEGPSSVFDRDADDAIAMLDCVLNHFPEAGSEVVLAAGWSRGAQVVMRMAERDSRITGVMEFCGMTDEWTPYGQAYMYYYLIEDRAEPDPADVYHHALWALKYDGADIWETRVEVMHTCIVYHTENMPPIQIHHGVEDGGCPIELADRLADVLAAQPGAQYEYYRYEKGTHMVGSMIGAGEHVAEFIQSFQSTE